MAAIKSKRLVRFEILKAKNGQFTMHVRAKNREIILSSETLKRRPHISLQKFINDVENGEYEIVDLTKVR